MSKAQPNRVGRGVKTAAVMTVLAILLAGTAEGKKKKEAAAAPAQPGILQQLDYSKIVWPNPPAIARIKYLDYFAAEPRRDKTKQKEKVAWMDRLAGIAAGENKADKLRFQLVTPYGVAVDSKGRVYVVDSKVLAVFIFDTQTKELDLIKNNVHARFAVPTGIVIDDSDRVFISDSKARRIVVFDAQHRAEGTIAEGLMGPGGMAIDPENRYLYVADAERDQVLVYDADPPFKLLRSIGTTGKEHTLTTPGDFSRPTNVAVDKEGNLYVADTLNDRIQVFDADSKFIRTWGKPGDGPGYFARPKGIAIDGDGHVWVADAVQDRVQVFSSDGRLLIYMGEHGLLPGQFRSLAGLTIDKKNRVFTSEQYPGRVQMFQYFSDAEAKAQKEERDAELKKKSAGTPAEAPAARPQPAAAAK